MGHAVMHIGDVFDVMAGMPDGSVDLVLTSPPFLALRSYLPAEHPNKAAEIGSEANPAEFIDVLLKLSAEWDRLLAPHGSIAIELGDTYSGSSQGSGDRSAEAQTGKAKQLRGAIHPNEPDRTGDGWPLAKSLALVPELYRIGLAYGVNPLTGEPSPAGRWRVRNVVRWVRPNPPVGALGDKFRPATSEMVVACKSRTRWFDLDAVRRPYSENSHNRVTLDDVNNSGSGAPPLDWWKISPKGYSGAHYAVWPAELCETPIEAMCPREVCRQCGEPRRRIVEVASHGEWRRPDIEHTGANHGGPGAHGNRTRHAETLGWSDCGHGDYRRGVVLDPFAGSGTTLAVATGHSRDAVGIDLDDRNAALAQERCGMFLEVA